MFIQTESTPNPATLKFLPGLTVLSEGSAHFDTPEQAAVSPLAERLFEVEGVTGVFLGSDFITIHKSDDRDHSSERLDFDHKVGSRKARHDHEGGRRRRQ